MGPAIASTRVRQLRSSTVPINEQCTSYERLNCSNRQNFTDVRKSAVYYPSQVYEIESTGGRDCDEEASLLSVSLELISVARYAAYRGTGAAFGSARWDDPWNCEIRQHADSRCGGVDLSCVFSSSEANLKLDRCRWELFSVRRRRWSLYSAGSDG